MKYVVYSRLRRVSRLFYLILSVALAWFFVWLVLEGSAQASTHILPDKGASQPYLDSFDSDYHIEFAYFGDDFTLASSAAEDFAYLLSQETGLDVSASIQFCEGNLVQHLSSGRADLAPMSGLAYVYGHDRYGIEARLVNGLFGQYAFRGQIIVPTSANYTDIWDLQDARFAAPNSESTSGYMLPYLLISETTGMTPSEFFDEVDIVGGHNQVVVDVYNGTADCGATFEDARSSVQGDYPDVFDVVSVLTYTEYIYQDTWVFRQGLDETVAQTLADGIIAVAGSTAGENYLEIIFGYDLTGIGTVQDSAYDVTRDLVNTFGLELAPCHNIYLTSVFRSRP